MTVLIVKISQNLGGEMLQVTEKLEVRNEQADLLREVMNLIDGLK